MVILAGDRVPDRAHVRLEDMPDEDPAMPHLQVEIEFDVREDRLGSWAMVAWHLAKPMEGSCSLPQRIVTLGSELPLTAAFLPSRETRAGGRSLGLTDRNWIRLAECVTSAVGRSPATRE